MSKTVDPDDVEFDGRKIEPDALDMTLSHIARDLSLLKEGDVPCVREVLDYAHRHEIIWKLRKPTQKGESYGAVDILIEDNPGKIRSFIRDISSINPNSSIDEFPWRAKDGSAYLINVSVIDLSKGIPGRYWIALHAKETTIDIYLEEV